MSENPRPHEIGEIKIGGQTYSFTTPKAAIVMSALIQMKGKREIEQTQILISAQATWLKKGLGDEGWSEIERRLTDDDDILDWHHLSEAFQEAIAQSSGPRPTTSSNASFPESRPATPSEEKPKQPESIFGI